MVTEELLDTIRDRATGRFDLQVAGDVIEAIDTLAPDQLSSHRVIRLRRVGREQAGWRTLLVASLTSIDGITMANRWAAEVRDYLPEPETADLYMILSVSDISDGSSADIEASELFCRKFVIRRDESPAGLFNRTFLSSFDSQIGMEAFADPLRTALTQTGNVHPWLDDQQREAWHKALLSGRSGSDIAENLLAHTPSGEKAAQ